MSTQRWIVICLVMLSAPSWAGEWTETAIRLLPDESFAVVETDAHGNKIRHCPYRDAAGRIDDEQLIRVLGRLDAETWLQPFHAAQARRVLERHYQRCHATIMKSDLPLVVDINDASLRQLVRLPGIGPVLAVRIVDYRDHRAAFTTPEDIMKVEGISRNTFLAIRHYIRTD